MRSEQPGSLPMPDCPGASARNWRTTNAQAIPEAIWHQRGTCLRGRLWPRVSAWPTSSRRTSSTTAARLRSSTAPCGQDGMAARLRAWAKIEQDTRRYVRRAKGDVFVITGPVFTQGSPRIGDGGVRVPSHLFKLVYDQQDNRAWAHWQENRKGEWAREPISYEELMTRTGVDFLPSLRHLTAGP